VVGMSEAHQPTGKGETMTGATYAEATSYYNTNPETIKVVRDASCPWMGDCWGVQLPGGKVDFQNFDDCCSIEDVQRELRCLVPGRRFAA